MCELSPRDVGYLNPPLSLELVLFISLFTVDLCLIVSHRSLAISILTRELFYREPFILTEVFRLPFGLWNYV